jgi:E3 ubiquitin-protein ligase CHFR
MTEEELPGIPLSSGTPIESNTSRPELFTALKRRASPSFEGLEECGSRKRVKENADDGAKRGDTDETVMAGNDSLAEELAQELQCGCCSELVYRPVVVSPCQHFFCGR